MKTKLTSRGLDSRMTLEEHLEIEADKITAKDIVCGKINIIALLKNLETSIELQRKENAKLSSALTALEEDVSKLEKQLKDKQQAGKSPKEEKEKA
jgi:cell division protein FtsB